jgi:SAM-dependent methyltransferase
MACEELSKIFLEYFYIFPWEMIGKGSIGFDMGCGTGRWAKLVAPRVGHLHCIDPSDAINVCKHNLSDIDNVTFHNAGIGESILKENSQDFGYSLGVLHHIPDLTRGLRDCASLLKPGAPFLVYIYYSFDNRNILYKLIWKSSDFVRKIFSHMPTNQVNFLCDLIAYGIYLPMAKLCSLLERAGLSVEGIPLSYYRNHSLYTMRTDSRDRFGTPLEKRYSKPEIYDALEEAGFCNILFADGPPFWRAICYKELP